MESKLNQLLKKWPRGTVATAAWLEQQGVYRQLSRRYAAYFGQSDQRIRL